MLSQKERVAIHEAGHAVIEIVLGGKVDHVTIEPDDPELGGYSKRDAVDLANAPGRYDEGFEVELVNGSLITMAGQVAEVELLGTIHPDQTAIDDGTPISLRDTVAPYDSDNRAILAYGARLAESSSRWATESWDGTVQVIDSAPLWKRCRKLVREHREAVQRVASALCKKTTLTGAEVEDLVRDAVTE